MGSNLDIRLAGRGGQGIVTAGELAAEAAFEHGLYAQAIPMFGPERRGGPALCSLRIHTEPILLKCNVAAIDALVMFDPSIWKHLNAFAGLRPSGRMVMNWRSGLDRLAAEIKTVPFGAALKDVELYCVDATAIAIEVLGRPIASTAMMGALLGAAGIFPLEALNVVIKRKLPIFAEKNIETARRAFSAVEGPLVLKG